MASKFGGIPVDGGSKFGGVKLGEPVSTLGISSGSPYKDKPVPKTQRQQIMAEMAEDTGWLESLGISFGKGLGNIATGLNLGPEFGEFGDPSDPVQQEAMAALEAEHPVSTVVGEAAGEAAPFLPLAGITGSAPTLLGRAVGTGLVTAAEGGAIAAGKDRDVVKGAGLGFGVGLGAEVLFPVIGKFGNKIFRRVMGKPPSGALLSPTGQPTQELSTALDKAGMTFEDLTQESVDFVQKQSGSVDPEQLVRKQFLESQGLAGRAAPTQAQVTRDAAEFQAQQEAAKTSSKARTRLENQEAVLTTRFNDAVTETAGASDSPVNTVINAVVDKATVLDSQISQLYKQAREVAPGAKNVRLDRLVSGLRKYSPANTRTGGNIEAIIGELKSMGVVDKNLKVQGKISVESAEEVRKFINSLHDQKNPFANDVSRKLKDTLDDDVFTAAGGDTFKEARKAKADFEKELSRAKISKFDSRKQNLVRDVLENKIDPDQFVDKVVFSKSWRADDIKQLKEYIKGVDGSPINDLKAEVLETIKNKAFIGPEDASGLKSLSRDKLESAINKIGWNKIDAIFDAKEVKFLRDMIKVSKMREPVRGTAIGRGPSAQAISRVEKALRDIPVLGSLVDFVNVDSAGRAVLKGKPRVIRGGVEKGLPLPVAAGTTAALIETDKGN